mmetsp:Transcript_116907/g.377287  ORF Transcript_116907/g.377287 Transcript_116907/m.377287 type:complete len:247 (-) Transcript_116907:1092-1832(-)
MQALAAKRKVLHIRPDVTSKLRPTLETSSKSTATALSSTASPLCVGSLGLSSSVPYLLASKVAPPSGPWSATFKLVVSETRYSLWSLKATLSLEVPAAPPSRSKTLSASSLATTFTPLLASMRLSSRSTFWPAATFTAPKLAPCLPFACTSQPVYSPRTLTTRSTGRPRQMFPSGSSQWGGSRDATAWKRMVGGWPAAAAPGVPGPAPPRLLFVTCERSRYPRGFDQSSTPEVPRQGAVCSRGPSQ